MENEHGISDEDRKQIPPGITFCSTCAHREMNFCNAYKESLEYVSKFNIQREVVSTEYLRCQKCVRRIPFCAIKGK